MSAAIAAHPRLVYRSSAMRLAAPALILGLALAGAASAQPVATAAGRDGELNARAVAAPAAGPTLTTAQQIDEWLAQAPPPTAASRAGAGPGGPWDDDSGVTLTRRVIPLDAPPLARTLADGQVHGEAGAEFGNLGYGGYGVVSGPLGKNGAVQIGVSHFEGNGGGRRWRGRGWNGGDRTGVNLSAVWSPRRDAIPDAPTIYTPPAN